MFYIHQLLDKIPIDSSSSHPSNIEVASAITMNRLQLAVFRATASQRTNVILVPNGTSVVQLMQHVRLPLSTRMTTRESHDRVGTESERTALFMLSVPSR